MRISPGEAQSWRELPKDRCTLVMLTGPTPGAIQPVGAQPIVMGRSAELPARIDDPGISSRHARIYLQGGQFWVEDLGSTNGTRLNGQPLEGRQALKDGDRIQLGQNTLIRASLQDATEQEAAQKVYDAAVRDPLTGLFNRGHLDVMLVREFAYSVRHGIPLCVLFLDLDYFSKVNNTYGHQAGDLVLRTVADAVAETIRTEDLAARYGGEEFVLVARGITREHGCVLGERVRIIIEGLAVPWQAETLRVTTSIGVAAYDASTPYGKLEELIAAADRAVYRAKNEGRNRVATP